MLIEIAKPKQPIRNLRRERRLWHNERHLLSVGCPTCPDKKVCGGLQVDRPLFDCLGFCCQNPSDCDTVCRNKPDDFARRVREVYGFHFDNVPRAAVLHRPELPHVVPLVFHGNKRVGSFRAPAVCLPLYKVIQRNTGEARYANALDLTKGFGIAPGTPIMLTGTDNDRPLERWWSLGPQRREAIRALRSLGISLVTTPNYSLFIDQPRWDDLHSMKRIAIVHEEFLSEGMPAALHVNARTDEDWERWKDYIAARSEVTHVAFEFGTGAGWAKRIEWHMNKLIGLAAAIRRPLHLVVRGGSRVMPALAMAFSGVTLLETSVFMKTIRARKRATLTAGTVSWRPSPTDVSEPLDALLTENWEAVAASYAATSGANAPVLQDSIE
jgi:hypothetical protein